MQRSETQFSRIFESGKYMDLLELSDANIRTDDGCNFNIHRVILAKSNDYFRRMFVGMGKRRRKFHIPGISGECLSEILSYIYTEDIQVTERNIADLIVGADYLLVNDLQNKIKDNIEGYLTHVNCFTVLLAAHQTSDEYIFRATFRFIQTRFEGIMRCQMDDLVHLPVDILERILSNRSLNVNNETTVWKAIVVWTQKDILLRMSCVPRLLLTLATEDIGEELATEILQHEIISHNFFTKDLIEITSSNDFSTNIDVLLTLLRSYAKCFTEPILHHRIPPKLFVRFDASRVEKGLCISYDENTDLWRKITEEIYEPDALIVIGHNVYIFNSYEKTCKIFDLRAMSWVKIIIFRSTHSYQYYVVAIDECIYLLLGESGRLVRVKVYNTVNNKWRNCAPFRDISDFAAVAIEKKIYVVGNSEISDGMMMMQMFDPDSGQWSIMSPPTVHHSEFSVVAYHRNIFLIGDSDTEVFDPATNLWKKLPGAFGERSSPKALVISDQIIVFNTCSYRFVCWNNEQECWENIDGKDTPEELFAFDSPFSTVDDIETIRMITKQNRSPGTQMENIYLERKK